MWFIYFFFLTSMRERREREKKIERCGRGGVWKEGRKQESWQAQTLLRGITKFRIFTHFPILRAGKQPANCRQITNNNNPSANYSILMPLILLDLYERLLNSSSMSDFNTGLLWSNRIVSIACLYLNSIYCCDKRPGTRHLIIISA